MVAKQALKSSGFTKSLNLAKIHMVAKQQSICRPVLLGLNLAKIHMVAKHLEAIPLNVSPS